VKRKQALLGSTLPRDNRVQEALNNALNDGGGAVFIAVPPRVFIIQAFLPMPLKPNIIGCAQCLLIFFNSLILLDHPPIIFRVCSQYQTTYIP
jgi:hypothetical protein